MDVSGRTEIRPLQEIVEKGITQVPEAYVLPPHLLNNSLKAVQGVDIPVIDLSGLLSNRPHVVRQIGVACKEWGCFQVTNHGINPSTMTGMLTAARHFYSVPVKDKMSYFTTVYDNRPVRYSTSFHAARDSVLEWKDVLRLPTGPLPEATKNWPREDHLPRKCTTEYFKGVSSLLSKLLEAISESLGLDADYLSKALANPDQISAINYYPQCPNPDVTIGVRAHTDPSAITMLLQDQVGGFQAFNRGRWIAVNPVANALIVNIGDQLQVLSNGRYQSGEHRVVADKHQLRISVATFLGPCPDAYIAPAPKLVDSSHPSVYKEFLYRDFMADYVRRGPNVRSSIDHVAREYPAH